MPPLSAAEGVALAASAAVVATTLREGMAALPPRTA